MKTASLLLVLALAVPVFASKDVIHTVAPVVKHPAVITRSVKAVKFLGKHSVVPAAKVVGKVLF